MVTISSRDALLDASCPARDALALVGEKWVVMVILLLADGPWRFGRLRKAIGGISQKMLTQTLRNLERNGLVSRRVYATTPPSVEYGLTALGQTLVLPLEALSAWTNTNLDAVLAARERFEALRASDRASEAS
jgi:DNA-binding HxlR family transcriptional regulator